MFLRRKRDRVAPDRDAVVDRTLCVSVTAMLGAIRGGLEAGEMDEARAAQYVAESHRWLRRENLADALSHRERFLIAKPLAQWTAADAMSAARRSESAGVLQWALSVLEAIPPDDTRFEAVPSGVPLLAPTHEFRAAASLRPAEEIASARDAAEAAHRRAQGLPAGASPSAEHAAVASGSLERLYALDWLCGRGADWDD